MKRLLNLTTIILLVVCNYAVSQTGNHLDFKGVEINGSSQDFVKNLKTKGFSDMMSMGLPIAGGATAFIGRFLDSESTIVLLESPKTKSLYAVVVMYPYGGKYSYDDLNEIYSRKYGKADSDNRFHVKGVNGDDIGLIFFEVGDNSILIWYRDKANWEIQVKEVKEIESDEI